MAVEYSGNPDSTKEEIKKRAKDWHGLELTEIPEFCKYIHTFIGNVQIHVFLNYYYSRTCRIQSNYGKTIS